MKLVAVLIKTYFMTLVRVVPSVFIWLLVLQGYFRNKDELLVLGIAGSVSAIFILLAFCLSFLLPLAFIDKATLKEAFFGELLARYLPLVSFPLLALHGALYWFLNLYNDEIYIFLFFALTTISVGYIGLWTFLKQVKQ